MNIVFKIIFFSLFINFAIGATMLAFPQFNTGGFDGTNQNNFTTSQYSMGLGVSTDFGQEAEQSLEGDLTPQTILQSLQDSLYQLLDTINLGFIAKFINAVDSMLYGSINMLSNIFRPFMGEPLGGYIFTTAKFILGLMYLVAAFYLYTGRDVSL